MEGPGGHWDGALLVGRDRLGTHARPGRTDNSLYSSIPRASYSTIGRGPLGGETPEVADDVLATALGTNGFRVILDGPEGLGTVLAGHKDATVLLTIVGPAKRDDVGLWRKVDVEGMISHCANVADAFEDL